LEKGIRYLRQGGKIGETFKGFIYSQFNQIGGGLLPQNQGLTFPHFLLIKAPGWDFTLPLLILGFKFVGAGVITRIILGEISLTGKVDLWGSLFIRDSLSRE